MDNIDKKRIQWSKKRLVVSGRLAELYEYGVPYSWNLPPPKRGLGSPCKEKERRTDNLFKAQLKIRRLISCNVLDRPPVFMTLTFAKNITNLNQANREFTKFTKRLNRHAGIQTKYLTVVEFQKRGAIHYHTLYFNLPYLDKHTLETKIWKQGFTNLQALQKNITEVKNLGLYISKYLKKQKIDKRLTQQKCYFTSRGLKKPEEWKKDRNIDKILENTKIKETYQSEVESPRYGIIKYKQFIIL